MSSDISIPHFMKSKFQDIYLEENVTEVTTHYQLQYSHSLGRSVIYTYFRSNGMFTSSETLAHSVTAALLC